MGAILGGSGVGFGAFGAHGLEDYLQSAGYAGDDLVRRLAIFDTAVRYQLIHAIALVVVGLGLELRPVVSWRVAAWAFLLGIALFSGLLKVLTFAGPQWNWLGMVVPLGGLSMIVGWLAVAAGALWADSKR